MALCEMRFDVHQWLREKRKVQRKLQVEQCNAICQSCGADVLDALSEAAYDWGGFGEPSRRAFECPECGAELEYELEWVTELYRASCIGCHCQGEVVGG